MVSPQREGSARRSVSRRREAYSVLSGRRVPDFVERLTVCRSWAEVRYDDVLLVLAVTPEYILLAYHSGELVRWLRVADVRGVDLTRSRDGLSGELTVSAATMRPLSATVAFMPIALGGFNSGDPTHILLQVLTAATTGAETEVPPHTLPATPFISEVKVDAEKAEEAEEAEESVASKPRSDSTKQSSFTQQHSVEEGGGQEVSRSSEEKQKVNSVASVSTAATVPGWGCFRSPFAQKKPPSQASRKPSPTPTPIPVTHTHPARREPLPQAAPLNLGTPEVLKLTSSAVDSMPVQKVSRFRGGSPARSFAGSSTAVLQTTLFSQESQMSNKREVAEVPPNATPSRLNALNIAKVQDRGTPRLGSLLWGGSPSLGAPPPTSAGSDSEGVSGASCVMGMIPSISGTLPSIRTSDITAATSAGAAGRAEGKVLLPWKELKPQPTSHKAKEKKPAPKQEAQDEATRRHSVPYANPPGSTRKAFYGKGLFEEISKGAVEEGRKRGSQHPKQGKKRGTPGKVKQAAEGERQMQKPRPKKESVLRNPTPYRKVDASKPKVRAGVSGGVKHAASPLVVRLFSDDASEASDVPNADSLSTPSPRIPQVRAVFHHHDDFGSATPVPRPALAVIHNRRCSPVRPVKKWTTPKQSGSTQGITTTATTTAALLLRNTVEVVSPILSAATEPGDVVVPWPYGRAEGGGGGGGGAIPSPTSTSSWPFAAVPSVPPSLEEWTAEDEAVAKGGATPQLASPCVLGEPAACRSEWAFGGNG